MIFNNARQHWYETSNLDISPNISKLNKMLTNNIINMSYHEVFLPSFPFRTFKKLQTSDISKISSTRTTYRLHLNPWFQKGVYTDMLLKEGINVYSCNRKAGKNPSLMARPSKFCSWRSENWIFVDQWQVKLAYESEVLSVVLIQWKTISKVTLQVSKTMNWKYGLI